jgi:hypothetical protein
MPWTLGPETERAWAALARLHDQAVPLLRELWSDFSATGVPPTAPLWLSYPGDREAARQDQEWMVGPDVLVAPVVEEGATSRDVYFPAGCWNAPDNGERHTGPAHARVTAPLARLPYFTRCGTEPFATAALLPSARKCVSRRRFRIHVPRRLRAVRVRVDGRRVRVRRHMAIVDLRGLRKGRFRVRITAKTTSGRAVRATRRYRTCTPRRP